MKSSAFIIFISIVTLVYGLMNFLIYYRSMQAIPVGNIIRGWFPVIFWILVSAYPLARFLERLHPCDFTEVVTWIGSLWLGIMAYSLITLLAIDILRLINFIIRVIPSDFYDYFENAKWIIFCVAAIVVFLLSSISFINARIPRIKKLDLAIHKTVPGVKTLKIVMASDIHMGTLIAKNRTKELVERINQLHPDLILFAGDVVDEDIAPVIRRNLGQTLGLLKAKYGIYAITGNHEYIGGAEAAVKYLSEHGVTMLRDSSVVIEDRFVLVGRDDRDKPRFTGKERKTIEDVMKGVDRSKPVIMMDHQPFLLEKVVEQGVDLQLSGHTHHGQLWPFNYITSAIYEISWGYKQIGKTHFYVSSGYGSWGPPMRLGNRPEIVEITIHFD